MDFEKMVEIYYNRILFSDKRSPKTAQNRKINLLVFNRFLTSRGVVGPQELTYQTVKDFFEHYASKPMKNGKLPSHNSVDTMRKHVRYFLRYMQIEEEVKFSFNTDKIKGIGVAQSRKQTIPKDVVYQVTKDIADVQLKLINVLLFESGIRIGELVTLRRENITRNSITVLGKGTCGGRWRQALIPVELGDVLLEFCRSRRINSGCVFRRWQDHKNCACEHIAADTIRQKLKPYYKRYGYNMTPHIARHTFAQELLKNGADVRTIQACLGHRHLNTTQEYLQVPPEFVRSIYTNCIPKSMITS